MSVNYWQGIKVLLRAPEEKDLNRMLERRNMGDSFSEMYHDELSFPKSPDEIEAEFELRLQNLSTNDKRLFILEDLDGCYVGELSIWYTRRRSGIFRMGFLIEEKYRQNGYCKEAVLLVMNYYFNELNYNKASQTVYSFNKNSILFHENLGFTEEGRLKNQVYCDGKYCDLLYYGLMKEEFNSKHKRISFFGPKI